MPETIDEDSFVIFRRVATKAFVLAHAHSGANQDPESLFYLEWCKDKLEVYPDSKNEIEKLLINLGEKGVNLKAVVTYLHEPRSAKTRQMIQGPTLIADFKKHREHLKKEKSIRNAVKHLLGELKPVLWEYEQSVDVNRKVENLIEALRELHPSLEDYLDLLLVQTCAKELGKETGLKFTTLADRCSKEAASKLRLPVNSFRKSEERDFRDALVLCPPDKIREWIKEKRDLTSRTHNVWSGPIYSVVHELVKADFTDGSAYKNTAMLFKLQYPEIFNEDLEKVKGKVKAHYRDKKTKKD